MEKQEKEHIIENMEKIIVLLPDGKFAISTKVFCKPLISLGCTNSAKVSDVIKNRQWLWVQSKRFNHEARRLLETTPNGFQPGLNNSDKLMWTGSNIGVFTVASAVDNMRVKKTQISHHQPRNPFAADLFKLALATTVYHIWRCKNEVVLRRNYLQAATITKRIIQEVQLVTSKCKVIKRVKSEFGTDSRMRAKFGNP
ncbi:hypothetical protein ACH5RR_036407 [Cinchona calisaya]|uniref:Uncharacterized protein n=1 Tax=Cinchona calisaya TaxID=153742 RepID=A0ABD2Y373_9GENT